MQLIAATLKTSYPNDKMKPKGRCGILLNTDGNLKWHNAFFGAIRLELSDYINSLEFTDEYQLSKEALRIDVLIVKKDKNIKIEKNIGNIFKGNNIVEYKSEDDYISIDDFYKVFGYTMLYKSFEKAALDDITITFIETKYPRDLIKHLKEIRGFKVTEVFSGIYYVEGDLFPIQIIESKKLSKKDNLWMQSLRSNLNAADMIEVLKKCQSIGGYDLRNAYISAIVEANFETLKEVIGMGVAELDIILKEAAEKKGWFNDAEEKAKLEMAREMLIDGEPVAKIIKWTKLPISAIEDLQKNI